MEDKKLAYWGFALTILAIPAEFFLDKHGTIIAVILIFIGCGLLFITFVPVGYSWKAFLYGFIPLQEGVKKAYEANHDKTPGRFAEHAFGEQADPLGWFAHALIGSNVDQTGVTLYGCKPHLNLLLEIPRQEYTWYYLIVTEDSAVLQDRGNRTIVYDRLHIKKSEMKLRIKEISTWDIPNQLE